MHLFRIKPGKLDAFLAWGKYLQQNPEALETLKEEQVGFEAFYYFRFGEDYFAVAITDNPNPLPATLRELNIRHKAMLKECLEPIEAILPVYTLKT